MRIIMEADHFCFQGDAAELRAFFESLRGLALGGITVREYLHHQLH